MLAYVFWHWRVPQVDASAYEERQIDFQRALAAHKPEGFYYSRIVKMEQAPWVGRKAETYEDWYIVENSAALDVLDHGAVNGPRKNPHDQVAQWAEGGTGGLYRYQFGEAHLPSVNTASWFSKPAGMNYETLFGIVQPIVEQAAGTLWVRQMTMGPATEFCFHSSKEAALPELLNALEIPVKQIWLSGK